MKVDAFTFEKFKLNCFALNLAAMVHEWKPDNLFGMKHVLSNGWTIY